MSTSNVECGARRPPPSATLILAGLLIAASVPPWGWWPAAFVGIALLDSMVANRSAASRLRRGMVVGAAWALPSTLWVVDLSPPGWILAAGLHAVGLGLATALVPAGRWRRPGLVGAITLAELVRWSVPFGGVPLASIALGQAGGPLAPVVRVAGPLLLVALTVAVGMVLSALFDARKADRSSLATIGIAAFALFITGLLAATAPTGRVVGELDVALVQGGGPQRTRATPTGAATVFANQVEANQQVRTPVDLVVWPENVVNPVPEPASGWRHEGRLYADDATAALATEATRLDAVLVPGWFHRDADDPTANLNYQTAIEPDGSVVDRYDKVRTVPFGEYVPMRALVQRLAPDMLPARDLRPGTGPAILDTSVGRLGIAISWEVFFEHRTRDAVTNGGEVIVNPTNGASYWLTQVQTQQVAASRLRALETGRWVLQVAPTGFSAVIDPRGRVLQRTDVGEQAVLHHRVERRQGLTWASRMGTWPMAVLSLLAMAGAWTASRRRT
ncbi:MAG: apolipoprotein N-acyltransferase [Acidimicrobiales bacterium]|nr:apolipoprotein N-acyltransferase [Acidimicrobiaceae bacterium]MBT6092919.1 apolipoprotein N-acyltransferase [Acidimicrobiaceae bacterium]MDG2161615.1 apolipoprotein N-acyltransferase [Acidimicrobiales bacterium]